MPILKNSKHEHFAHQVALGESPGKAYVIAGYSVTTEASACQSASRLLLRNVDVANRVEEIKAQIASLAAQKAVIDKVWVLNELVEIVKMGKSAVPVFDKTGKPTGEYKADLSPANRALELIGKEIGMFVDKTEVRTGPLDGLGHDELKQIERAIVSLH